MAKAIQEKIILGIDPGTSVMGYGVIKVEEKKALITSIWRHSPKEIRWP
jgi:crossover junction endodeoxyribonuclease RuvC